MYVYEIFKILFISINYIVFFMKKIKINQKFDLHFNY